MFSKELKKLKCLNIQACNFLYSHSSLLHTGTDNNHNEDQNEINAIMNGLAADNDDSNGSAAEYAENYYNRHFNSSSSNSGKGVAMFSPSRQKLQQSRSGKSSRSDGKGGFRSSGGSSGAGSKKPTSQVDPDVIMLGRDALDRELRCLYQPRPNGTLRYGLFFSSPMLVCSWTCILLCRLVENYLTVVRCHVSELATCIDNRLETLISTFCQAWCLSKIQAVQG